MESSQLRIKMGHNVIHHNNNTNQTVEARKNRRFLQVLELDEIAECPRRNIRHWVICNVPADTRETNLSRRTCSALTRRMIVTHLTGFCSWSPANPFSILGPHPTPLAIGLICFEHGREVLDKGGNGRHGIQYQFCQQYMAVTLKHDSWLPATSQQVTLKVRNIEFSQEPKAVETLKYTRRRHDIELVAVKIPAYHRVGDIHKVFRLCSRFE
jgi:hypothetical protein